MRRLRALATLCFAVLSQWAMLAALLRLRSATWIPSPTRTLSASPDEAIYGVVWMAATALTVWLAATTVLSIAARATRIPSAIRAVDCWTHPAIRRITQRVTAVSMVATSLASPAVSASEPPPIPVVTITESTTPSTLAPLDSPVRPITVRDTIVEAAPAARYTVRPGDNMWTIAAGHLKDQLAHPPTNARIHQVWRLMIELNTTSIRSGNVDLIYPGEQLILPPITAGG